MLLGTTVSRFKVVLARHECYRNQDASNQSLSFWASLQLHKFRSAEMTSSEFPGNAAAQKFIDAFSQYEKDVKKECDALVAQAARKEAEVRTVYQSVLKKRIDAKKMAAEEKHLRAETSTLEQTLQDLSPLLEIYEKKAAAEKLKFEKCREENATLRQQMSSKRKGVSTDVDSLSLEILDICDAMSLCARSSQQEKTVTNRRQLEEEVFSLEAKLAAHRDSVQKKKEELAQLHLYGVVAQDRKCVMEALRNEVAIAKKEIVKLKLALHKCQKKLTK